MGAIYVNQKNDVEQAIRHTRLLIENKESKKGCPAHAKQPPIGFINPSTPYGFITTMVLLTGCSFATVTTTR
jgi:hypothetical protein